MFISAFNFCITVFAADIVSVEYTPISPFVFYENIDGEMTANNYGQKYFRYKYYLNGGDKLTIKYSDNTEKVYYREEFTGWFTTADQKEFITPSIYDNQAKKPWTVGTNYIIIKLNGNEYEIPVVVKAYDIESIDYIPKSETYILEHTCGFDENWMEQPGAEVKYIYTLIQENHFQVGDKFIINYIDGTSKEFVCRKKKINGDTYYTFYDSEGYELNGEINYSDNQYKNRWCVGEDNYYTLTYLKNYVNVPVEIIPNDVFHIFFTPYKPIVFLENQGGAYVDGFDLDNNPVNYYHYDIRDYLAHPDSYLTVRYKDGTEKIFHYNKETGYFYDKSGNLLPYSDKTFHINDNQDGTGKWRPGQNKFIISYKNVYTEIPAVVINAVPKAPKLTKVYNRNSGIVIEWQNEISSTEYRVYRRAAGEKYWTYLGTTDKNNYVDNNVKNNNYYKYTVRGCNYYGFGSFEDGLLIKRLEAAKVTSVTNTANALDIKWNAVEGATGYIVYRKIDSSNTWHKVATTKSLNYTDTRVASGHKFTYTIMPVCGNHFGAYDMTGLSTYRLYPPKVTSLTKATNSMSITWSKSNFASGYRIYRREAGKPWQYLTTVDGKTFKYTDTTAKHGTYYTYTVKSVLGNSMSVYLNGPVIYY